MKCSMLDLDLMQRLTAALRPDAGWCCLATPINYRRWRQAQSSGTSSPRFRMGAMSAMMPTARSALD